jgi:hypothetical protein
MGIAPLLGLRANSELCSRFGPLGDHGSESSGSPVVASTKRWNCEESAKGSVGESHVCGRGFFDALLLVVEFETVVSGNVRARVGEGSKGASSEFIGAAYPCEVPYGWYAAVI